MRLQVDEWAMQLALITSRRSTCLRRHVGCVLLDRRNRVLATGYNGVASGQPHCNEGHPCVGAEAPSGVDLDLCHAIHAEQNALIQCKDPDAIDRVYVTTAPCISCQKLLLCTGAKEIIYLDAYPHPASVWNRKIRSYNGI